MRELSDIGEMTQLAQELRRAGKRIGFVPTMGALHAGHLSLLDVAREHCDCVVLSIFLNPTQFNVAADFEKYPQTLEADLALAKDRGADICFLPSTTSMYPRGAEAARAGGGACRVIAGDRSQGLCGAARPGHFDGVVNVVNMLFNVVQPDVAVFGEKDFQQLRVIEQMVQDLHLPVRIVGAPIVRDVDGLALSSRNLRLSTEERYHALFVIKSLRKAQEMVVAGERDVARLIETTRANLELSGGLRIDYVEVVDDKTLTPLEQICDGARMLIAVFSGDVRLIDNVGLSTAAAEI